MNALNLITRELERIAGDLLAYVETGNEAERRQRGRSIAGRIMAFLVAEEEVLYATVLAVSLEVQPSMFEHHERLKQRVEDAMLRHDVNDAAALPAMLKLQQEMFRYAQCHRRELYPQLRCALSDSELRLLGGEMLLVLCSHRKDDEERSADVAVRSSLREARRRHSGVSGSSRSRFDLNRVPVLKEVLCVGAGRGSSRELRHLGKHSV